MNWDHPYITMNPQIEANTVRAFGHALQNGYISRKNKNAISRLQTIIMHL
mgnify:CR=1 FL=1